MKHFDLSKIILASVLTAGVVFLSHPSFGSETDDLKNQVKALQQKVDELEKQLGNQSPVSVGQQQPARAAQYRVIDPMMMDPFMQMQMMERQMQDLMKENAIDFNPREDIKQLPDAYVISMDIPGMEKDNINVEVKNGMLIVSGDRTGEVKEEKPNKLYRQERSFGHFYRSIALPEDAKPDTIDAQYKNGVLTVKIQRVKTPSGAPNTQKIKVK
jgi:HSP20 family protein